MVEEKERTKDNEELSISSEKLKSILFDNALVGLGAARGTDGKMILTNKCLSDIFGFSSPTKFIEEFKTTEMWKNPASRQHMYNAIKQQGFVDGFEAELLRKDGSSFWARWAGAIIPGTNLLAGAVIDISKEKELLASLQTIDARYTALIESTLIGIQIVKTNPFSIHFVNPAACRITGYSEEELVSFTSEQIATAIHPDDRDRVTTIISESVEEGVRGASYDFRLRRKNGEWIWVRNQASLIRYGNRPTYMITFLDITSEIEAKEREAHLQEVELYASILTHDIGNDIQTIMSFIDIAELDIPKDNPATEKAFQAVNQAIDRIQYLLKAFKLDRHHISNNISEMLNNVVEEVSSKYPSLTIDLQIDESVKHSELEKYRLLPLVFENLIRNTIQTMSSSAHIWIKLDRKNDFIDIFYSDNGPDIPASLRSTLFKRGANTIRAGIGLNLAKKIVTGYGGTIEFIDSKAESKAGFQLQFPVSN